MTKEQIQAAVARGVPFTMRMADGKEYPVPHRDYIWLPPRSSNVFVYHDTGHYTVLPLLTMTGLHIVDTPDGVKDQETPSGPS